MSSPKFTYECPNCDTAIEVTVLTFGCPAKVSGPPEDCYPAEDMEIDVTDVCPNCSEPIEEDAVAEDIIERLADQRDDYPERE